MQKARELLDKYRSGNCTPEEEMLLKKWFHHLHEGEPSGLSEEEFKEAEAELRIQMDRLTRRPGRRNLWTHVSLAASILLAVSIGFYFLEYGRNPVAVTEVQSETDIAPGSNQALLTLSDGRKIHLGDAGEGKLAEQSGIHISKAADGQLVYTVTDVAEASASMAYNTIATPLGGQYQVNLPDGSRVWLNSGSSLRYPVKFGSKERRVEISGEVYFEIAHDPSKPFRVSTNEQVVEVLGTHFNIMAYPDEQSVKTTLVEGSVKVIQAGKSKLIRPGQQASLSRNGTMEVLEVDTDEVTAWKEGFFVFKSEDLGNIMRQISRWYNVEVEYQGNIKGKMFGGKISRTKNVSEVLQILELTESIHFKIVPADQRGKGRRIIVMP